LTPQHDTRAALLPQLYTYDFIPFQDQHKYRCEVQEQNIMYNDTIMLYIGKL